MKKCREYIRTHLPKDCPLIRHCDLMQDFCNLGDSIEVHPRPCYGNPCSCVCEEVSDVEYGTIIKTEEEE